MNIFIFREEMSSQPVAGLPCRESSFISKVRPSLACHKVGHP